ncbi:hypothetical protein [Bdellovibrio bacteriovorus]|uniref:hypothetical protein n=1 Tax=Bdellovibrio bacteriovorus TaxID=959 RepID=UPI0035A5ADF4
MQNVMNAVKMMLARRGYQVEQNNESLQLHFRRNPSQNFYGIIQFRATSGWCRYGVTGMFLKNRWVEDLKQLESLIEAVIAEYESWP